MVWMTTSEYNQQWIETEMKKSSPDWCMTLNNYTEDDCAMFTHWGDDVKLIKISKEIGESGTPHLQGRILFRRGYRLTQLKKLHSRVHWKPTKCCQDSLYIFKEGSDILVDRDNRRQGKRCDLDSVFQAVKDGYTVRQLWEKFPNQMVRYSKGILEYKRQMMPRSVKAKHTFNDFKGWAPINNWDVSHIIIGKAGIGKTQWALCHFENPLFVSHMDDLKNLSEDNDGIIFDDMDFKHMPRNTQIFLLDQDQDRSIHARYEAALIPANTKKIFTCNEIPFKMDDEAIRRRCQVTQLECEQINCERSERKVILDFAHTLEENKDDKLEW